MMPPICQFCGARFADEFSTNALLRFKLSAEDEASNRRMKNERRVGHPKGAYWFCNKHVDVAREFTHLEIGEAMAHIRRKHGPSWWNRMKRILSRA